jgi:hypothetical protein
MRHGRRRQGTPQHQLDPGRSAPAIELRPVRLVDNAVGIILHLLKRSIAKKKSRSATQLAGGFQLMT